MSEEEMTWNYRVTVIRTPEESLYEIREIYYEGDSEVSWTVDPIAPRGETFQELVQDLAAMTKDAHSGEILDITDPDNPRWLAAEYPPGPIKRAFASMRRQPADPEEGEETPDKSSPWTAQTPSQ